MILSLFGLPVREVAAWVGRYLIAHVIGVVVSIGLDVEGVVVTKNIFLDAFVHVSRHR